MGGGGGGGGHDCVAMEKLELSICIPHFSMSASKFGHQILPLARAFILTIPI